MSSLMKKMIFLLMIFTLALSACSGAKSGPSSAEEALTQVALNVSTGLTQTAASIAVAQPSATMAPLVTEPPVVPTEMPTMAPLLETPAGNLPPSADLTALPPGAGTAMAPQLPFLPTDSTAGSTQSDCKLRASMEYENYPDNTQFGYKKDFTKLWRLKNVGTCDWPAGTELMFVSGDLINAGTRIVLLTKTLPVNQYVEAKVDFTTPSKVGFLKSNWMLVTPEGRVFGTGENGKGTFWVLIEVINKATYKETP